jgi:hypothetical protein
MIGVQPPAKGAKAMTEAVIARVRDDIHALNCKLAALRNEEQRFQLQRQHMEAERDRLKSFIEMQEIAEHYGAAALPGVAVEVPRLADAPPAPSPTKRKLKPDGIPTTSVMIITALQETGRAARPPEIADYIRKRWWPKLQTGVIGTAVWHMAQEGKLEKDGGLYKLNGHGGHHIHRVPRRLRCEECGTHWADPPSKLCPGCQAYREHQPSA